MSKTPLLVHDPIGVKRIHLVEQHREGKRLGRHVRHDPRSRLFPAPHLSKIGTVTHLRNVPIFDQGELGSCTGNAGAGCVSTAPFKQQYSETDAVQLYSDATKVDNIMGQYPPTDTGSDGLSIMKVLQARGTISGYTHAFSCQQALGALQLVPGITGLTWLSGCDTPNSAGLVKYRGMVRGGHEVELVGTDAKKGWVKLANSWGPGWGFIGYFFMTFDDYARALEDNGDATFPSVPAATLEKVMNS